MTGEHGAAQLHQAVRRQLQGTGSCTDITTTYTPAHATFNQAAKQSPGESLDLCATITTPGPSTFYELWESLPFPQPMAAGASPYLDGERVEVIEHDVVGFGQQGRVTLGQEKYQRRIAEP